MKSLVASCLLLIGCAVVPPKSDPGGAGEAADGLEIGGRQQVGQVEVLAWSRRGLGGALEVGVTVPRAVVESPPEKGDGPAGAIAVVAFPEQVRRTTFFDHFELHWEPHGHPPEHFSEPHFDFHFYGLTPEEVRGIAGPEKAPDPERMPPGFLFLGAEGFVPQMGNHTVHPSALEKPFELVMIAGIVDGRLAFVEPMSPQAWLLENPTRVAEVPVPQVLGRKTLFPRSFALRYVPQMEAYELVFSQFEPHE